MERRTRRSASTIGGAAPDTIIERAAADCAGARPGARPYRATRCENVSKWAMPVPTYAMYIVARDKETRLYSFAVLLL